MSARLNAVEAENRRLRNEILQSSQTPDAFVRQASYCEACGDVGCGCDTNHGYGDGGLGWQIGPVRVTPFGYAAAEMIGGERAYTLLGAPLFLLPAVPAGIPDSRFTVSGQQTTLGFNVSGPDFGGFQSGANIAFNFFGDRPVQNNPGVFFLIGYVELKNESWRFWAGQDPDSLGRQNSNSPAWTAHRQSGNFGQIRPGFRAERFFQISDVAQTSIYLGLTQQVVLDFIANPMVAGTDNGWPNVEIRWELGFGQQCDGQRPVTFAVGGLIGETRAVDFAGNPLANVSTTWVVIPEVRIEVGSWGFQGEAFVGEALGTYNAGIGQSLDPILGEPIYTAGGFGEVFCNVTPQLTVAVGYGVDDPRDADLSINQRARNESYWVNAIWRLTEQWETRFEISRQKTDYIAPSVNSRAMLYHFLVRYNF